MAERKKIYLYIAANLSMLIPVPGRFVYAVILLVLFNIQMAITTLLFHAVHRMDLASMRNTLLALAIIAFGILYKQILIIFCPVAALTLSYCIFLPTLASVIIEFFFLSYEHGVKGHLISTMKKSLCMSVFSLVYFFLRDIIGYGTLTFPAWKKIITIELPFTPAGPGIFFATIPGGLCLLAMLLALYIFVSKKLSILDNSPLNLIHTENTLEEKNQ